ncbi:putative prophage protein [Escherichia coli]|uniref:Putative prophage protein n=1 Tax=Escherichia coli TaxID=562 RepID=A0A377D0H4_ECOLX|nr:putative prophage protein [Escherichia coli]
MRDDRFNSLKQEFSGVSDDAADALSAISELIRAALFLLGTKEYKSTGIDVLNITADYAEYIAESDLRKMSDRG